MQLHREHGELGDVSDIKQLVLRMAIVLVEADKGILLSREDEDGDGSPLDVVATRASRTTRADSAVANTFASQVIEADRTLREDDSRSIEREGRTDADDEIENLVAIPIYIADEFSGVVVCANRDAGFEELEDDVLLALGDHAGAVLENTRLHGALRTSYLATVAMLAEVIEAKDPFLRGHSDEVSRYVSAVADQMGIDTRRREKLVFGSLLHDVGKVGISERILLKPAALTPEERSVIQLHPRIGYRLVERVPALREIAPGDPAPPRALRRRGLPGEARGRADPARGADHLRRRLVQRDDRRAPLPAPHDARGRLRASSSAAPAPSSTPRSCGSSARRSASGRSPTTDEAVEAALEADPELQLRRLEDEPLLGQGPLAVTDNLTLLYTHRYFHEVAAKEAERARVQDDSFGVVLVEPTDIAADQPTDGYAAGDDAIRAVATAVQRAAVRVGGTACRHGGTRIGLIAPGADDGMASRLASEIAAELDESPRVTCGEAAWRRASQATT